MKEREGNPNQSELTQKADQSTLSGGDVFMADEGVRDGGVPNPVNSVDGQDVTSEIRQGGETLGTPIKKDRTRRRPLSSGQDQRPAGIQTPILDVTKERTALYISPEDLGNVERTREQVEEAKRLLAAIEQGQDAASIAEAVLQDMGTEIPPSSIKNFRRRISVMAKLKTQLVPPVLEKLVTDIRKEPQRIEERRLKKIADETARAAESARIAQENVDQKQQAAEQKVRLEQAWSERIALADTTPSHVRSFVRAAIANNVSPDQIEEEAMTALEEMAGVAPRQSDEVKAAPLTEQEQFFSKIGEIFDDPETKDSFDGIAKAFESVPPEIAEQTLTLKGEGVLEYLTHGLPTSSTEKYINQLNGLSKDNSEEFVSGFRQILGKIKAEREKAGLEGPGESETKDELERLIATNVLPDLNRIIPEAADDVLPAPLETETLEEAQETLEETLALIADLINNLATNPESIEELRHSMDIGPLIGHAYDDLKEIEAKRKEWEDLLDGFDDSSEAKIRQTQARLSTLYTEMVRKIVLKDRQEAELPTRVKSAQELARWIMETQDSELWGKDGIYPLLDEQNNFSEANFITWMRYQSVVLDKDNPNSEMKPLQSVGISTDFREISIYAMSQQKQQYLKDVKKGTVHIAMAQEMVYEAFMYGELRNEHLFYIQGMGDDKKISDVMQQVHGGNVISRPGNLRAVMKMPDRYGVEGDTKVGDAFRMGLEMYRHLSDKEELVDILGQYPITKEDFKNTLRILQEKNDWEENLDNWGNIHYDKTTDSFTYVKEGKIKDFFDQNGNIDMDVFVSNLNFYNLPSEDITKQDFVRELIRLKTAQKFGLKDGIELKPEGKLARKAYWEELKLRYNGDEEKVKTRFLLERKAARTNIEWAERLAFNMQRPYGGAAENDLGAAAADALVKVIDTQRYFTKQGNPESGGAVGVPEQIGLFKALAPNMLTALKTESGASIATILKNLRKIDNKVDVGTDAEKQKQEEKEKSYDKLVFKEFAESALTRNHYVRAVQLFHTLADAQEIDLSKIVTYSFRDGTRYNIGEFQKQINEELIKPLRYAIVNADVNFGDEERIFDGFDGNGNPIYHTGTVAEKMFGPKILNNENIRNEDRTFKFDLNTKPGRQRLAKNCSMAIISAQLSSHVKGGALGEHWGYNRAEILLRALETIQAYDIDDNGVATPSVDKNGEPIRFYSKKDIKWIRKNSGTEVWRMVMKDTFRESSGAMGGALLEMFAAFAKSTLKN